MWAEVVDVIHCVAVVFGSITVAAGFLRSRSMGGFGLSIYTGGLLAILVLAFVFRARLPRMARSILVLVTLLMAVFGAMLHMGIYAASAALLPVLVVIAWLIWSRRAALVLTIVVVAGFVCLALLHIAGWASIPYDVRLFDRMPAYWLNLSAVYTLAGVLMFGVTHTLLHRMQAAVRSANESEKSVRGNQERLAEILRGIHDVVFLHDPRTGLILEAYGRVQEMYGYAPEDLIGKDVQAVSAGFAPWSRNEAKDWIDQAKLEGFAIFPWKARRADGTLFWVEVSIRPIHLVGEEKILVTVSDIDGFVNAQSDLATINAELESRVEQRTLEIQQEREAARAFAYSVSHDLRSPLRAINGFTKILREDFESSLPSEGRQALVRIESAAERMGGLIEALLSLSKVDRHPIHLSHVDISCLIQEVREELCAAAQCPGAGKTCCNVQWSVAPFPSLLTDHVLARMVLTNVLGNACKFIRPDSTQRIEIFTQERADGTWCVVSDNGMGFDMAYADKLFQAFQRLHSDSVDGIGIGLATVKKALDRLGGAIEAEGVVGAGATFRFRLGPAANNVRDEV